MNRKTLLLSFLSILSGLSACLGQNPRQRHLYFGAIGNYILLNDRSIGQVPIDGLDAGLRIGFSNRGERSCWSISLQGTAGFMSLHPSGELDDDSDVLVPLGTWNPELASAGLPRYQAQIANRYAGVIEAEYLHAVNRPHARWRLSIGGLFSLYAYYNRILVFSNSESNYFFHTAIAPKIQADYPFRMWEKDYQVYGTFSYDILGVVARPSYSLPFTDNRIDNIRIAGPGGYAMAQIGVGLYHPMRNGNAWQAAYRWTYDSDSHLNRVRQAVHSLSFTIHINL